MKFSIEIELRNAPIEVLDDIVKTLSVWGEDMTIVKFNSQGKNESPDILGLTITEPEEIKPNDK